MNQPLERSSGVSGVQTWKLSAARAESPRLRRLVLGFGKAMNAWRLGEWQPFGALCLKNKPFGALPFPKKE